MKAKKLLRWVGIALFAILAVLFVGFLVIQIRGIPKYPIERVELKVEVTPERVLRGKKWATMLCAECHQDAVTMQLTGKLLADSPPEFGPIYSQNITKHEEKGIGKWTDGELAFFLRTGIKRDGQYVPPWMPKLAHLSEEDLLSIIAFLRSDDPLVAPADVDDKRSEPSFLTKFLCTVAFKPLPYPKQKIETPSTGDKLAYGKYLANSLECYACHSKDFKTLKEPPEASEGYLGGGTMMLDWGGKKIYTPNITMDEASGIGKWTDAQFRRAVRDGFRPDDSLLLFPMPKYVELTDDELNSMYAYFKTAPKLSNQRPRAEYEAPSGLKGGQAVYYKYRCDSCHGDTGLGVCDLRQAGKKFPNTELMSAFIKKPTTVVPGSHMPAWDGVIKEEEYGPLTEYLKSLGAK